MVFLKEAKDMVDLNWMGLAAGIGFGIMGWGLLFISRQILKAGNANESIKIV